METLGLLSGRFACIAMGSWLPAVMAPHLVMVLALTFMLVAHSVYVPSSARRTPLYMSPESIRSPRAVDAPSDVHSVETVGYWSLAGCPLFDGTKVVEVFSHELRTRPLPPSRRTENAVPGDLEDVLLRCLEKDPGRHPPSADALQAALDACDDAGHWTEEMSAAWWRERAAEAKAESEPAAPAAVPAAATGAAGPPGVEAVASSLAPRSTWIWGRAGRRPAPRPRLAPAEVEGSAPGVPGRPCGSFPPGGRPPLEAALPPRGLPPGAPVPSRERPALAGAGAVFLHSLPGFRPRRSRRGPPEGRSRHAARPRRHAALPALGPQGRGARPGRTESSGPPAGAR